MELPSGQTAKFGGSKIKGPKRQQIQLTHSAKDSSGSCVKSARSKNLVAVAQFAIMVKA